jgi:ryanodine receptor 2
MRTYNPQPLDTSSVKLSADLLQLTELLAKNTHEVWAAQRISEGWQYGKERDDSKKLHPCLVPYEDLPESEKEYDRQTAMATLRVIRKLGFEVLKNNKENELLQTLFKWININCIIERIRDIEKCVREMAGNESVILFWQRLIEQDKANPYYYSGLAQSYISMGGLENIYNGITNWAKAEQTSKGDEKLRSYYEMRKLEDIDYYYSIKNKGNSDGNAESDFEIEK